MTYLNSNIITSEPWKVGGDSAYQREYFVYNTSGGYAMTAAGRIRRFSKLDSASALADMLNLEDQQRRRESEANQSVLRHVSAMLPGPGRSFEQAELEDEIASIDGCAVKVWSDDGIGKTKRLHIHDPRGTKILKGVIIAASNTQQLEGHLETLERELEIVRNLAESVKYHMGFAGEALLSALETALALLGTTITEGITE